MKVYLTYKFSYRGEWLHQLIQLCTYTQSAYNCAYQIVKNKYDKCGRWMTYRHLCKVLPQEDNMQIIYKVLSEQTILSCLKQLDRDIKLYKRKIKVYQDDKTFQISKPKFLHKLYKPNLLTFYKSDCHITNNGTLSITNSIKLDIPNHIKFHITNEQILRVKIIPYEDNVDIEILYAKDVDKPVNDNVASIDVGINNIVTLVTNKTTPIIYSGKQLKSIIHSQTKFRLSKQSTINDMFHKLSKHIVDYLILHNISTLVIGYNSGWKIDNTFNKQIKYIFENIPFYSLITKLKYKCSMNGIKCVIVKESYTSKCDSLAKEK